MTLNDIRNHVLFQTQNDADDLGEFQPALEQYINEGYDKLVYIVTGGGHLDDKDKAGEVEYATLVGGTEEPALPAWTHRAIADYATYMIYRNGNAIKQNRGMAYYQSFLDASRDCQSPRGKARKLKNLYSS